MQNGDIKLYRKFIETMKLLNTYLGHFPKHEKYALCNRIKNSAYAVYDLIVEGQKRYHKKTTLTELDIAHEQWNSLFGESPAVVAAAWRTA